eukprot:GHVL01014793.1.p1 GENE.GHVL01014793.1~~GHVL01014793.1.p1  ORF type:complete len:1096 (+),score=177.47 GHVL01014793.1:40-3288(+)
MDAEQICTLLSVILGTNNDERNEGEKYYSSMLQSDPTKTITSIIDVIRRHDKTDYRISATLLLRNIFRDSALEKPNCVWKKVPMNVQLPVRNELFLLYKNENDKIVREKVGDLVATLASTFMEESNGWPELIPGVISIIEGGDLERKTSAIKLLGLIVRVLEEDGVVQIMEVLLKLMKTQLDDTSVELSAAVIALYEPTVVNLPNDKWAPFQEFLPTIMFIVQGLVSKHPESPEMDNVLENLVDIADEQPLFFKPALPLLCSTMAVIAEATILDEKIRCRAAEILISLTSKRPLMVKSCPTWVETLVRCLMNMLLELDCGDEDWLESEEFEEDGGVYDVAEEGFDRIAQNLGPDELMPLIFRGVNQFLSEKDSWKHTLAAIMCLSQVIEVVEIEDDLAKIIETIMPYTGHENPRVRYAALQALGQASLDHSPWIQENYFDRLMPLFFAAFDDRIPKISGHAFACFVNFGEEVEPMMLMPHIPALMQKCHEKLTHEWKPLREWSITCIAVIAGCIEGEFASYYHIVMPIMKEIVVSSSGLKNQKLRGKALECISIIGFGVGKEMFLNDGKETLSAMQQLQSEKLEDDDLLQEYLPESIQRICRVLVDDFSPFLPVFMPEILRTLGTRPEEVEIDSGDAEDMTMMVLTDGNCVGLRTSFIEKMQRDCEMLCVFTEVLGSKLGIENMGLSFDVLLPLVKFRLHDDLKHSAIKCVAELLKAMRQYFQQTPSADSSNLKKALKAALDTLFSALAEEDAAEPDLETFEGLVDGIHSFIESAGDGVLSAEEVLSVAKQAHQGIQESFKRRTKKGTVDDDEEEYVKTREAQVRASFSEVWGALLKSYPQILIYSNFHIEIANYIFTLLQPKCPHEDKQLALYVLCDLLEHLKEDFSAEMTRFAPYLIQYANDKIVATRQAACYGVQQAAKINSFQPHANDACSALLKLIGMQNCRNKKNGPATDNALAALFHILYKHPVTNADSYVNALLTALPVKHDTDEGVKVHTELMKAVIANNQLFLGPDSGNLAKILGIFAQIYNTSNSEADLDKAIKDLVCQLGQERIESMASLLTSKQRDRLGKICKSIISNK